MANDEENNSIRSAITAGIQLATVQERVADVDGIPCVLVPNGMHFKPLEDVLKIADQRDDRPRRLKGTAKLQELASFIAHINRFKDGHSAIFADVTCTTLTAVLDYHLARNVGEESASENIALQRWGEHRATYECPLSEAWNTWTDHNEHPFTQEAFADFIEQHSGDLTAPEKAEGGDFAQPAKLIEVARQLSIKTRGEFTRQVNPTTGEFTLVNKEEHDTSSTKIPRAFLLGIPVFQAGAFYRVEAQIRFQILAGRPSFSYVLMQPERILKDAFDAVRAQVIEGTKLPLFAGTPEA